MDLGNIHSSSVCSFFFISSIFFWSLAIDLSRFKVSVFSRSESGKSRTKEYSSWLAIPAVPSITQVVTANREGLKKGRVPGNDFSTGCQQEGHVATKLCIFSVIINLTQIPVKIRMKQVLTSESDISSLRNLLMIDWTKDEVQWMSLPLVGDMKGIWRYEGHLANYPHEMYFPSTSEDMVEWC